MRKQTVILLFWIFLILLVIEARSVHAQASGATELIDAVNKLRAANGLAPLQADSNLMSAAQAHSEYQASIGEVTHAGQDGSQPKDRAAAAGYGGGATFFLSENIAGGTNLSSAQAVSWWQADAPHLNTMLNVNAQHIGVGVAESGGFVYYTLNVGYISGGVPFDTISTTLPGSPTNTPASTPNPASSVQIATPGADGMIIHTVVSGQTLIIIADAYGVDINDLMALNGFNQDSVIYPDQELVIRAGFTATPTSLPTGTTTPTFIPTSTRRPTRTPSATAQSGDVFDLSLHTQPVPTPDHSSAQPESDAIGSILLITIAVLGLGGVFLIILGAILRRKA